MSLNSYYYCDCGIFTSTGPWTLCAIIKGNRNNKCLVSLETSQWYTHSPMNRNCNTQSCLSISSRLLQCRKAITSAKCLRVLHHRLRYVITKGIRWQTKGHYMRDWSRLQVWPAAMKIPGQSKYKSSCMQTCRGSFLPRSYRLMMQHQLLKAVNQGYSCASLTFYSIKRSKVSDTSMMVTSQELRYLNNICYHKLKLVRAEQRRR